MFGLNHLGQVDLNALYPQSMIFSDFSNIIGLSSRTPTNQTPSEIMANILREPNFAKFSYKELYALEIEQALPDDPFIDPNDVYPTIIMSDERFNDFFNNLFIQNVRYRWDGFAKRIPSDVLILCYLGIRYYDEDYFHLLVNEVGDKLTMEHYIILKESKKVNKLSKFAELLGVVPPRGYDEVKKLKYISNGLGTKLPMSFPIDDKLILLKAEQIGFKYKYETRTDLRLNFARWVFEGLSGIFVVLPPLHQFSQNKTTYITMENLKDIGDNTVIGYGCLTYYQSFLIDEFLHCIDDKEIRMFWPSKPSSKMSKKIVNSIIELLYNIGYNQDAYRLKTKLDSYLKAKNELSNRLKEYLLKFNSFTDEEKTTIITILTNLFMTGMYMRRWVDSAAAYPISKDDTLIEFNPDENVANSILKVTNKLVGSSIETFVNGLPSFCINYLHNNEISPAKMTTGEMIAKVVSGDACIRIYSVLFITTAQVYTKLFTDVDLLPNIKMLDYIN